VRQLVAGGDSATILIQVPARIGGLADTARFVRSLAVAASEFGDWCEAQNRMRSSLPAVSESWRDVNIGLPAAGDMSNNVKDEV
jgi:hypothetical protein